MNYLEQIRSQRNVALLISFHSSGTVGYPRWKIRFDKSHDVNICMISNDMLNGFVPVDIYKALDQF